jgi:cytochrome c biogenesis protein
MPEPMTKTKKPETSSLFWTFFSSVKLTIVLLMVLAAASVAGTLLPQGQDASQLAGRMSPGVLRLLEVLDLFDMYHAWWFRWLIGLLSLNLIVCSLDRFPSAWRRFKAKTSPDRAKPFEDLPANQSLLARGGLTEVTERVYSHFRKSYGRAERMQTGDQFFLFGEKGRFAYFGVYLVHLSVLLILVGALIGSFFGFEAYVNIPEGEKVDTVFLRRGMLPMPLDFQVRCDRFFVEFYDGGMPKEYRSDLAFLVEGKEVSKQSVLVNHPVTFRGVTFYQSSYGAAAGGKAFLRVTREADDKQAIQFVAEKGQVNQLPGKEGTFQVVEVEQNLKGGMGPAVLISLKPNEGKELRFWILKDYEALQKRFPAAMLKSPALNPSVFKPYTFHLDKVETRFYTGLQVNKDPGVSVVWAGCFLMIAGFMVAFFTSHRRIWIRVTKEKRGIRVSVAGTSSKNPVGLERELGHLALKLKAHLGHDTSDSI